MSSDYQFDGISVCTTNDPTCNYDVGSSNFYSDGVDYDAYGYNVTKTVAIAFVALFGLGTLIHLGQAIWSRHYWLLYTIVFFGVGETLGWVGRLWSATSTTWLPDLGGFYYSSGIAFQIQICCLIISPALAAAGNYLLLKKLAAVLGSQYFIVHPFTYTAVFITGDVISLVVQAVGGGIASSATTLEGANQGAYVMVAGVFIQLVVMIGYTIILITFNHQVRVDKPIHRPLELFKWWPQALRPKKYKSGYISGQTSPSIALTGSDKETGAPDGYTRFGQGETAYSAKQHKGAGILLIACCISNALIFARSIYRSIELLGGWRGKIIQDQTLFDVMDGALMCAVLWLFIILHPGFYLRRQRHLTTA